MTKKTMRALKRSPILLLIVAVVGAIGFFMKDQVDPVPPRPSYSDSISQVGDYSGSPYVIIADNIPEFDPGDYTTSAYEEYAPLDELGRCGVAMACVGRELMPTQDRGDISSVKPTGWENRDYDFVDGGYVYNRCHLIGFQLTGENANECNLITGTRYMNVQGMLPFENDIADYIRETGNHVLYRVTPVFQDDELLCRGVQMEAMSMEDRGAGLSFHVYVYNVQPGVSIYYENGDNWTDETENGTEPLYTYILNTSNGRFHAEDCPQAQEISKSNRMTVHATRRQMAEDEYTSAGCCEP